LLPKSVAAQAIIRFVEIAHCQGNDAAIDTTMMIPTLNDFSYIQSATPLASLVWAFHHHLCRSVNAVA